MPGSTGALRKILTLGVAASAASLGLVAAQEIERGPPLPPGYVPGVGYAPLPNEAAIQLPAPVVEAPVILPPSAAPPEEAELPPQELAEAMEPPAPVEPPAEPGEPQRRPRFSAAILQAVDKVTGQTLRFEAKVGEPVRYKGLVLTVNACEGAAPDEGFSDAFAHVGVQAQPERASRARVVFRGWMFASSPALHAMEHPLYDMWLIACRTPAPLDEGASL